MTEPSSILQRLRATGLRPTMACIGVLQVIEAAAPASVCANDVFRKMLLRGTRTSVTEPCRAVGACHDQWRFIQMRITLGGGRHRRHVRQVQRGDDGLAHVGIDAP